MFDKNIEIKKIIKDIWHNICVLERDYGVEWDGHMTQILKFTLECIADKYKINLNLQRELENERVLEKLKEIDFGSLLRTYGDEYVKKEMYKNKISREDYIYVETISRIKEKLRER